MFRDLILNRCRELDGPITQSQLAMFQLGSKPFPRRSAPLSTQRVITQAEREKLVAFRSSQVAAGIEIEVGESWQILVDNS
jgi:hypothetical protein